MAKCPVCLREASHLCSGCREAAYCSKEHQLQHWKQHKAKCRHFEVQQSPDLGRHLVANRDIDAGTLLISELPLILGPKANSEPVCLGCYQPVELETCSRCPACEWPACSPFCPGLTHQEHHLPECIVLSLNTLPAKMGKFNYDAILPLRCLCLQKKSAKRWKQLLNMESHFKDRGEATEVYKEVKENIVNYLKDHYLSNLESGTLQNTSDEIIHIICGIIEVNGLEITTGDGEITALYPNACLMEHNCMPNVKYKFRLSDFKITVESSNDIKKDEHLSTMYTHTLWGTSARRDHLIRTKYFLCKCARCSDPTELGTHFSTLKCISSSPSDVTEICDGIVLSKSGEENDDWHCTKCPLVLSAAHVSDLVTRLGAQIDSDMENPTVVKLENLLKNLEKLLHPNHYHCFTVAHSLIQLWGRERGYQLRELSDFQLQCKIDLCQRLINITKVLDPRGARTGLYTGVCLLEESNTLEEQARRSEKPIFKEQKLSEARDLLEAAQDGLDEEGPASHLRNVIRSAYARICNELNKYRVIEIP